MWTHACMSLKKHLEGYSADLMQLPPDGGNRIYLLPLLFNFFSWLPLPLPLTLYLPADYKQRADS